jgi:hypothetical protein
MLPHAAGAEGAPGKGKRGRKLKAAAGAADGDGDEEEDEELPRDIYDPPEEPMQIKMEWVLINKGAAQDRL